MLIPLYFVYKKKVAVLQKRLLDFHPGLLWMLLVIPFNDYRYKSQYQEPSVYTSFFYLVYNQKQVPIAKTGSFIYLLYALYFKWMMYIADFVLKSSL